MKRTIIAVLLLSVLASSAAVWAQAPQNPDAWMKELFTEKPAAKDQPLNYFIFPGTHDGGTYPLNDDLACESCAGVFFTPWQDCVDALAGTVIEGLGLCDIYTGAISPYLKPWAEAQHMSVGDLLAAGARQFDLRFFRATAEDAARTVASDTPLEEGKYYIHHTLAGPELGSMLDDIQTFLANPVHDEEILILNFSSLKKGSTNMPQEDLADFFKQVRDKLGPYMAPEPTDECRPDPTCVATQRFGPRTTIRDMLDQPGGNQVIVTTQQGFGFDLNQDGDTDDAGETDDPDIWRDDSIADAGIYNINREFGIGFDAASGEGYPRPDDDEADYTLADGTTTKGQFPWITDRDVDRLMKRISPYRDSADPNREKMFRLGLNVGSDEPTPVGVIRGEVCVADPLNVSGFCGAVGDHPTDPSEEVYWDEFESLQDMAEYFNPRAIASLVGVRRDRVNIVSVDHFDAAVMQEIYKLNRGATRVFTGIDQVTLLDRCDPSQLDVCTDDGVGQSRFPDLYPAFFYGLDGRGLAPVSWANRLQRNLYADHEDSRRAGGWPALKAYPNDWGVADLRFVIFDADDGYNAGANPDDLMKSGPLVPGTDSVFVRRAVINVTGCFNGSAGCPDISAVRTSRGNFPNAPLRSADNVEVVFRHDVCAWSWLQSDLPSPNALCDTIVPSMSITDVKQEEGASGTTDFDFVVMLSGPSATQLSVDFFLTSDITVIGDFVITSGTLVFEPGETRKIVTVQVRGDTVEEPDEFFTVNLTWTTNDYVITDGEALGTILNDDSPASVNAPTDQSGDEGSGITFDLGTLIDARGAAGGPYDVVVDWGDNLEHTFSVTAPGPLSAGHTYRDNGSYDVTVSITDGAGLTLSAATFRATIANVDPTATLSDDGPVNEGGSATVTVTASDASTVDENQGLRYAFSCTDGSLNTATYANSSTTASTSCDFDDEATNTVRVRVIDKDDGYNEYTTSVTVNGVKPTATLANNGPIDEGQSATLTMSNADDPSSADRAAGFRYAFSCSNESLAAATYAGSGTSATTSCPFPIDGTYTVRARIIDKDGEFNEYTNEIVVRDVAPTLTAAANQTGNEGAAVSFNLGNLSDPGPDGPWAVAVNWGDGASENFSLTTPGAMTRSHTYADNGSYNVTVSATDNGGNASNTVGFTAAIANVAPTAALGNNGPIFEGGTATISFGSASDPSSVDTTAGFHYAFSCSNGSLAGATYANSGASASTTCSYPDNGSMTVRGKIIDKNGGSTEYTTVVVVNNRPPTVSIDVTSQSVQYSDDICRVTITATDTPSDSMTAVTSALPGNLTRTDNGCSVTGGLRTCSWTLSGAMNQPMGSYPISTVVSDDDGDSGTVSTNVNVEPEAATIRLDQGNSIAVQVDSPGGDSPAFSLTAYVTESEVQPVCSGSTAYSGNLVNAEVELILSPVGPGSPYTVACSTVGVTASGYDQVLEVSCAVDDVDVNTYHVQASVVGDYYAGGPAEDALVVFDPSLGFTTGGGWFYWPGSEDPASGYPGDKTNFGYNMKYKRNGRGARGNLLMIRHLPDGSIYRVKSNAMHGMSLGEDASVPMGWATLSGKCTYLEPDWAEPIGNQEFLVYVEDRDEPGTGQDRFWLEVLGQPLSMVGPAIGNTETIDGGNIVVPHQSN